MKATKIADEWLLGDGQQWVGIINSKRKFLRLMDLSVVLIIVIVSCIHIISTLINPYTSNICGVYQLYLNQLIKNISG